MKIASLVLLLVPMMAIAVPGTTKAIEQPSPEGPKTEVQLPGVTIGPAHNQAQTLRNPASGEALPGGVPRSGHQGASETGSREVEGGQVIKLSAALVPGGNVSFFTFSADGQTVVYAANQDAVNVTQLYSVPIGGGPPTQLSAMPAGFCTADPSIACMPPADAVCGGVTTCPAYAGVGADFGQISSDGTRVAYLADQDTRDLLEFYSVPIGGGASTKLNLVPLTTPATWGLTTAGTMGAYFGVSPTGNIELYSVPIAGPAGSSVQLSSARFNPAGNVTGVFLVPGGARILYLADQDPANDNVFDLYTVPIGGPAAAAIKLNSTTLAFTGVTAARASPDNSRVVYLADEDATNKNEIYSVPALGPSGTAVKLNGVLPALADVVDYAISPDSSHVSWRADATTDQQFETFSRVIDGTSAENALSGPLVPGGNVATMNISPDSLWTVFQGDVLTDAVAELFSVPTDGSAGFMRLHESIAGENTGFFTGSGTPVVRGRVLYPLFDSGGAADMYTVPVDGTQSPLKLNNTLPVGGSLFSGFLPASNSTLMAYAGHVDTVGVIDGYTVPVSRSQPPRKFNTGGDVGGYAITSTQARVVYLADQDTAGVVELYARVLDSDGDGVVNGSDNCPLIVNPAQLEQTFGQTILASSKTTFSWPTRVDIKFVRGPLDQVGSYATNDSGSLPEANSLTDTSVPGDAAGSYYSVAPDCEGGSHETTLGAEPGRGGLP